MDSTEGEDQNNTEGDHLTVSSVVAMARESCQLMLWSGPLQSRLTLEGSLRTGQTWHQALCRVQAEYRRPATGHDTTAPPSSILSHHQHPPLVIQYIDNSSRCCVGGDKEKDNWTVGAERHADKWELEKLVQRLTYCLQLIQLLHKNTKNWFSCYCEVIKFCSILARASNAVRTIHQFSQAPTRAFSSLKGASLRIYTDQLACPL